MAVSRRPRDGYPTSWGNVRASVFPIVGPSSYTQYTAPSTGGQQVVTNGSAGIKTVDFAIGGPSNSGLYRAEVVHLEAATVNGVALQNAAVRVKWYVIATGAQVAGAVDLSAEVVYLQVTGPK